MRFASFPARLTVAAVAATGLLVVPATGASASSAKAAAQCAWNIQTLEAPAHLSGYQIKAADGNYVVGNGEDEDWNQSPVLWHGGRATVLETPDGASGSVIDVNARGQVVGRISGVGPVLWSGGEVIELAVPEGADSVIPSAINDSGLIVGNVSESADDEWITRGIAWSADSPGEYQDLGAGQGTLRLADVNDAGTIVADTSKTNGEGHTTALRGTLADGFEPIPVDDDVVAGNVSQVAGEYTLGTTWAPVDDYIEMYETLWQGDASTRITPSFFSKAVNADGLVAGRVGNQGAVWTSGASITLPTLAPGVRTDPTAVTDEGTVLGVAVTQPDVEGQGRVPVIWTCA